ncbi:MAG: hypothetical protein Q9212_000737 [Teloschistes hypoglaucus]
MAYPDRPRLKRAPSATSSLAGMEKPFSPKEISSFFEIYQDPVDLYRENVKLNKPLPPTPRKPSSVYSVQRGEEKRSREERIQSDLLPSSIFLAPTTYRSSTSRLPDPTPIRPQLTRQTQTQAASDTLIRQRLGQEQQLGREPHSSNLQKELTMDSLSLSEKNHSDGKQEEAVKAESAEKNQDVYTSVLHMRSSASPVSTSPQYYVNQRRTPSPMSGRITDVVDESLLPAPLNYTSFEESERPSSRFSSSSSEAESHHDGMRTSLKGMARKAFHRRKGSKNSDDTDWAAFTRFQEKTSLTPRRQSRIGSFVDQRRASLQQSISGMYETLTSLTTPSKGPKPAPVATKTPPKHHRPRIRSPAIPLTPYQEMGPKAWETSSKSSKKTARSEKVKSDVASKSASKSSPRSAKKGKSIQFSTPKYEAPRKEKEPKARSVVNKLTSAFSSGTVQVESAVGLKTERVKQTRSEKKRAELKKKIKVIGLGKPETEKKDGP